MLAQLVLLISLLLTAPVYAQTLGIAPAGATPDLGYTATAADFDGTSDDLRRGADLTSSVDDRQGVASIWYRADGGNGSFMYLVDTTNARVRLFKSGGDRFEWDLKNANSTFIMFDSNSAQVFSGANWHHLIWAWDTLADVCQIYIDDVDEPVSNCDTPSPPEIDGTQANWFVMTANTGGSKFNGCISEYYYHQTTFIDLDIVANRRLFNDGTGGHAGGKPVSLGSDGSTPTSSQPIVYLNGDETNLQTNQGSGGNFVVTGTLGACSSSPSD